MQETFQKLLSLAVVLQLVPFIYMFGALLKIAADEGFVARQVWPDHIVFCGSERFGDDDRGIALAFFPAHKSVGVVVRSVDVRWNVAVHRIGGVFLFRLWPAEGDTKDGSSGAGELSRGSSRERLSRIVEDRMSSGARAGVRSYQNYVNGQWVGSEFRRNISGVRPVDRRSDRARGLCE